MSAAEPLQRDRGKKVRKGNTGNMQKLPAMTNFIPVLKSFYKILSKDLIKHISNKLLTKYTVFLLN